MSALVASRVVGACPAAPAGGARPRVRGKFLFVGDEKLYVRGVTYGTFRPTADGGSYHRDAVERDFADIVACGFNAVRTYTLPPRWLLDAAQRHGLRVMVGMWWAQNTAFLDEPGRADAIERQVFDGARACAGHPAVLCYVIGNEIPAPIVRWLGRRRVARFLERLYRAVKAADPDGLVTYVSYPSTEYLRLPFIDLVCFNVYLESQDRLDAYLARLHNLAGERPLIMGEIGLDSRRNGEEGQSRVLDWQVRTTFASGCAGAFVFSWTDEWHCGGRDIEDWDFGLTRRDRSPKPALDTVTRALAEVPLPSRLPWPRISVVVCTYNGQRAIRECMEGLCRLDYPEYEVIVVDDGSTTDAVATIVGEYREHDVRLIRTPNRGLSAARNTGLAAATGEIVAYIDDDACPDTHWLTYLAATFLKAPFVGVGGPNLPLPDDGPIADCVANAPGSPTHVLLSDEEAEHIPGCNMAYRKAALEAIGGFDPQFRVAGDDVDLCWRLRDRGWKLGFSPAAVVWHHRRNSVRAFWKQQRGYGRAEAMLERKWPQRYNAVGHIAWTGRIYASYLTQTLASRAGRIYYGSWGGALFQSLYEPVPDSFRTLLMTPEWYLVLLALAILCAAGT
ncbi:MAG TPA: glycosyltransferase, partial [Gemmatimonadaceae bacterium]